MLHQRNSATFMCKNYEKIRQKSAYVPGNPWRSFAGRTIQYKTLSCVLCTSMKRKCI